MAIEKRRASSSRASSGSNSQCSRVVRSTRPSAGSGSRRAPPPPPARAGRAPPPRPAGSSVSSRNSPVLRSTAASPTRSPAPASATRKLFLPPASHPSCSSAPGVTVSTTSRRTRPRASFGSSTCSQMATRWPDADELAQILRGGLHRHAREGHAVTARGEGDLEHPRGELGVLVEHFVEVADPVEQNRARVLRLHLAPMLEHRRGGRVGGLAAHGGHGREHWRRAGHTLGNITSGER